MRRRIYTLDVFTATPFAGNPLAVVTDGDNLSSVRMQSIAREMNLSETVFVQRPTSTRALAKLRIFTTTQELPLAGHPVIGTWFLLADLGVVPAANTPVHVLQQTGAGILPVAITFKNARPTRVTMTQKPARFAPARLNGASLAAALGLKVKDFHPSLPLEFVSSGIFNLMVPLRDRRALSRIRMDLPALARVLKRATMAYCFALGPAGQAYARGMLPWGIMEDPATGSAGGSLAAYLVKHGRLGEQESLRIAQGVEMRRPSEICAEVRSNGSRLLPEVTGTAVRIIDGHIEA
jgi:trans-2,3-dihydro-3-hydroxyanthranilate isomerase